MGAFCTLILPRMARGATLLYIDLNGRASALWEQNGGLRTWGVPSIDGRHVAMLGYTFTSRCKPGGRLAPLYRHLAAPGRDRHNVGALVERESCSTVVCKAQELGASAERVRERASNKGTRGGGFRGDQCPGVITQSVFTPGHR